MCICMFVRAGKLVLSGHMVFFKFFSVIVQICILDFA